MSSDLSARLVASLKCPNEPMLNVRLARDRVPDHLVGTLGTGDDSVSAQAVARTLGVQLVKQ